MADNTKTTTTNKTEQPKVMNSTAAPVKSEPKKETKKTDCTTCKGTGLRDQYSLCDTCNGSGKVNEE